MRAKQRHEGGRPLGRRLRFEPLEERSLLSAASPGQPVISDSAGHLFAVSVGGTTPLRSLGTMDEVMLDIGFTPAGTLLGVKQITTSSSLVTSGLFSIPVNLETPTTSLKTALLGAITYNGGAVTLNSLDVRSDGTVFAAGTDSIGHGYLFTLNAGTTETIVASAAMDLGSFLPAGDLTFDTTGNIYLSTSNSGGHLLKINSSVTTITDLGATGITNFMGLGHGSGYTVLGFRESSGGVYKLDTSTAAATLLTTLSGSGLTDIYGAAVVSSSPLSVGQLDFRSLSSEQAFAGNFAYNFTAAHSGLLTAELPNAPSGTDVQFTLYSQDSAGNLTQIAIGSGARVDLSVTSGVGYVLTLADAPATFDLRLANLVSVSGDTTTVLGTSGDDTFTFTAGSPYSFTINDVSYPFGSIPAQTAAVAFYGGSGLNTAELTGGADAGVVTLSLLDYSGSYLAAGVEVHSYSTSIMTYTGAGGDDTASLTGTSHNDTITLSPQGGGNRLRQSHLLPIQVTDVPTISLDGGGSKDTATFNGGTAALTATVDFRQADCVANDVSYATHLSNIKNITAKAGSSGNDLAIMTGSPSSDVLVSTSKYVSMFAATFSNAANGFASVQAYGGGGEDSAQMYDGAGSNQFTATPTQATLSGSAYHVEVNQFTSVVANKVSGAIDTAILYGSTGNDILTSTPAAARLAGSGYAIRANAFDVVYAYSNGGRDVAVMSGASGNDTYIGRPSDGTLFGADYYVRAKSFRHVYAYAGTGGVDQAILYDSAGTDLLVASGKTASFSNTSYPYVNQASRFAKVTVISNSGTDITRIGTISFDLVLQGF